MEKMYQNIINLLKIVFRKKPIYLNYESIIPFDCDQTLVLWEDDRNSNNPEYKKFKCPYGQGYYYLKPHLKHIELMKKYKKRGFAVKVWSHGGAPWAREVVKVLELEKYVDIIETKPDRYVDDLECKSWMGNRVYIKE